MYLFSRVVALIVIAFMSSISFAQNWTCLHSGTSHLFLELDFPNDSCGWVVGTTDYNMYSSVIQHTMDGGNSWTTQTCTNPPFPSYLEDVMFINDSTGWAVGGGGAIRKTSNRGVTWTNQSVGTSCGLHEVFFTDSQHGWVAGDFDGYGRIFATTNGGTTWNLQWAGGGSQLLEDITFLDNNIGWAVGWNGTVLKTINGGLTWVTQNTNIVTDYWDAAFTDSLNGWIVGIGHILHTTDGGTTWSNQSVGSVEHVFSVNFLNTQEGWICKDGEVLHTTNGGVSWVTTLSPSNAVFSSVRFRNPNLGWVVGYDGLIYRYTDQNSSVQEDLNLRSSLIDAKCFPNPFNATTTISIQIQKPMSIEANLYDVLGRRVLTLLPENTLGTGVHQYVLNGKDLPTGSYYLDIKSDGEVKSQKIVLLK